MRELAPVKLPIYYTVFPNVWFGFQSVTKVSGLFI